MILVKELYQKYGKELGLTLVVDAVDLLRKIKIPEIYRPGLSLTGLIKDEKRGQIVLFAAEEMEYLKKLDSNTRKHRLRGILSNQNPAVLVSKRLRIPLELLQICLEDKIPLFKSNLPAMQLENQLTVLLRDQCSKALSCHGTLVEAFGIGILIQGDSSVGKSEAALGLIERGHRLISDDIVQVNKTEGEYLEGKGPELTRHLLEIRGIGIINVAHLYGAVCISESMRIDMIVKLEAWDDNHFYDRVGLEEKYKELLGIKVPEYLLPVKPGRDVVLLLETTVLNHRLKQMGYNSAKEFNVKLLEAIATRRRLSIETQ